MVDQILSLYTESRLSTLDHDFVQYLQNYDQDLYELFSQARLSGVGDSDLILEVAQVAEKFIAQIFSVEYELQTLKQESEYFSLLYKCKRLFVQRYALKKYPNTTALDPENLYLNHFDERQFVVQVMLWWENQAVHMNDLNIAAQYASWAVSCHPTLSILFQMPKKVDHQNLITTINNSNGTICSTVQQPRRGFDLTCPKPALNQALNQAHYCIFCHKQQKDSCRKGLQDAQGLSQKSPLGNELHGCPLDEKISEMNLAKSQGGVISALAIVMIDNPLCVLTGHKICNDCSKACIYQKQDPVDIPMVETRVLEDVLNLTYGFEIYSLLTRWNPVNFMRPLPKPQTNKNILVVGLGPAGINLSHHLLNDGHNVVAIDGLKIEPLPSDISGIEQNGTKTEFTPIRNLKEQQLYEPLSERIAWGFGGVSEYGITARWDKNYLKIARLILERRENFRMFGSSRLGSNITIENSFALGFDHIALALGSGKPNLVNITNSLARGVRMASDFLMSLQLTGASKSDSIANLQMRLPVVVVGGGLTAVDTATEALAYYPLQVEKFLVRYEILVRKFGHDQVEKGWDVEEKIIAREFIEHAIALRKLSGDLSVLKFLHSLGGVKIVYRKKLTDSPSYRLNSSELQHALVEGVMFIESQSPVEIMVDDFRHVEKVKFIDSSGIESVINARTVLFATGTAANSVIAREEPWYFQFADNHFVAFDSDGNVTDTPQSLKPANKDCFLLYNKNGRSISFFGDIHPTYQGSVVKAMASSKNGYPIITKLLTSTEKMSSSRQRPEFFARVNQQLKSEVVSIERLGEGIVEVTVRSPLAAQNFQPGQFFRLQNFEVNGKSLASKSLPSTKLVMEGLALTGSAVDKELGLISLIILEMGGSSDVCSHLQPGEQVALMGPTGSPTEIPSNENVLLIGGGLGNAVLFSIGQAMLVKNCKVLYCAGYKKLRDVFKKSAIENAASCVIWACDEGLITNDRPQDVSYRGNIIDALLQFQAAEPKLMNLTEIDRIITIGSDKMMEAVAGSIKTTLSPYFKQSLKIFASINSPMQCMMKEICAQCLQKHVDPATGEVSFVYSCTNQDQNAVTVSFGYLAERLKQNSVQEKLTAQWLAQLKDGQ